jgi:hypothetical protein
MSAFSGGADQTLHIQPRRLLTRLAHSLDGLFVSLDPFARLRMQIKRSMPPRASRCRPFVRRATDRPWKSGGNLDDTRASTPNTRHLSGRAMAGADGRGPAENIAGNGRGRTTEPPLLSTSSLPPDSRIQYSVSASGISPIDRKRHASLVNQDPAAKDILGMHASLLRDAVLAATDFLTRVAAAEQCIGKMLDGRPPVDDIDRASRLLVATGGRATITLSPSGQVWACAPVSAPIHATGGPIAQALCTNGPV